MKSGIKNIIAVNVFAASVFTFANAADVATNIKADTKADLERVETSVSIKKADLNMLYGSTGDKDADAAITEARKAFFEKYSSLKEDYATKINEIAKDKALQVTDQTQNQSDSKIQEKLDTQNSTSSASSTKSATTSVSTKKDNAKKILITTQKSSSTKSSSASIAQATTTIKAIDPTLIILNSVATAVEDESNTKATENIESRGWFGKLKAWFK